jgi:hypothetical protein
MLECQLVEDGVVEDGVLEEGARSRLSPPFSARFDVDSGRLSVAGEPDGAGEALAHLVGGEKKAVVAEILRRRWRQAKGLEDRSGWKGRDWSWWRPGALISYYEVFPDARDLVFTLSGRSYWAVDQYCTNPECDCREVLLSIHDCSDSGTASLGAMWVDHAGRVGEVRPGTASEADLRGLWRALEPQEALLDALARRHEEMKTIGGELAERAGCGSPAPEKSLSTDEIVARLMRVERPFPRRVLEEAIARREEITPLLLRLIEDTIANAEEFAEDSTYFAHIYACFLLAQFRERQAVPTIIRLASLPGDIAEPLLVDTDLARILASVAHGDPGPAMKLAADRSVSVWSRAAAVGSLVVMVGAGELDRARAIELVRELLRGVLRDAAAGRHDVMEFCDLLVSYSLDLFPEEVQAEIREVFDRGLVDSFLAGPDDLATVLAHGKEEALAALARRELLITDAVADLERWDCFRAGDGHDDDAWEGDGEEDGDEDDAYDEEDEDLGPWRDPEDREPALTIVREAPKVGRNDPCPCGSGKKHKRCCWKA